MAVFLFFGQEDFLMEKEINKLKKELIDDTFSAMAYKVFDNPEFNGLMDCIQASPLMFGNTLSLIYIDKYLTGNELSLDDKQIEAVDNALKSINNNVNIIFICKIARNSNKKPDSRKKFYKTLAKYSQVKEFAQFKTYQKELITQITSMAKEKDLTASSDTVSFLIEQLGANLRLIDSELEKLKVALYPNKNIDKASIKKYCTLSEDVFILADLIIQGNKNEAVKQYNLLTEKRYALEILSVLQSNFQRFIFIKNYEKKMSAKDIAQKLNLHEFIIMKTQEKLKKTSLDNLIRIRENLINAEYKLKSGQSSLGEKIVELAILS